MSRPSAVSFSGSTNWTSPPAASPSGLPAQIIRQSLSTSGAAQGNLTGRVARYAARTCGFSSPDD